jgi:Flp pilus assembly protein TadD
LEERQTDAATRAWVQTILKPVQDSLIKVEQTLNRMGERQEELYDAHSALLRDRQEQERKLYEEQIKALRDQADHNKASAEANKFYNRAKNYAPVFTILAVSITLITTFVLLATKLLDAVLASYGITVK